MELHAQGLNTVPAWVTASGSGHILHPNCIPRLSLAASTGLRGEWGLPSHTEVNGCGITSPRPFSYPHQRRKRNLGLEDPGNLLGLHIFLLIPRCRKHELKTYHCFWLGQRLLPSQGLASQGHRRPTQPERSDPRSTISPAFPRDLNEDGDNRKDRIQRAHTHPKYEIFSFTAKPLSITPLGI